MIRYIPVQLIEYVLKQGRVNDFKTFLYFKYKFNKAVFSRKNLKDEDFKILNISKRTFYRHLDWMAKSKLVSEDPQGNIFLRSWKNIGLSLGLRFTSKADFHYSYLLNNNHRGYMMGVVITYHYRLKRYLKLKESKKGGLKQVSERFQPLSVSYFCKVLDMPYSTVFKLKKEAIDCGFIEKKRNLKKTLIKSKGLNINELRNNWSDHNEGYPKIVDGIIVVVGSDLLKGNLHLKRYR